MSLLLEELTRIFIQTHSLPLLSFHSNTHSIPSVMLKEEKNKIKKKKKIKRIGSLILLTVYFHIKSYTGTTRRTQKITERHKEPELQRMITNCNSLLHGVFPIYDCPPLGNAVANVFQVTRRNFF